MYGYEERGNNVTTERAVQSIIDAAKAGYDLSVAEVAEVTGYNAGHVQYLLREKRIDAVKIKNRYYISAESVVAYLRASKQLPSAQRRAEAIAELTEDA